MLVETLQQQNIGSTLTEQIVLPINPFLDEFGYLETEKVISKSELPEHRKYGYVVIGEAGSEYTTFKYDPLTRSIVEGKGEVLPHQVILF